MAFSVRWGFFASANAAAGAAIIFATSFALRAPIVFFQLAPLAISPAVTDMLVSVADPASDVCTASVAATPA